MLEETDLLMMLLLVFLPSAFGLLLLLIPNGAKEVMRWLALFGSAATLIISLCILIDFYSMLDSHLDANGRPLHGVGNRLENRVEYVLSADASPIPRPRLSNDWVVRLKWIERFNIYFMLGIDGISMPLILLTTIVLFLAVLASWNITQYTKGYLALLLFLETGVLGSFLALDFFLFFVFYEVMLLPMYFLIGLWGGQRRKYAAIKFVLYTLLGSVCILIAMISLYFVNVRDFVDQSLVIQRAEELARTGEVVNRRSGIKQAEIHTFDIITLQKAGQAAALKLNNQADRIAVRGQLEEGSKQNVELLGKGVVTDALFEMRMDQSFFQPNLQYIIFLLLFIGFAVKVPIIPLHSWLPDAHVEAPTPISMVLAGILLKLGGYGIIRFAYPICPWAAEQLSFYIGVIGVIGIVYGAFVALGQSDFKRLLAYSSISHMGYVILGLAVWTSTERSEYWSWGLTGAMFQMVAHGITAAALFFVVGVIYDRAHHRDLNRLGGLMEPMPLFGALSVVLFFASMGLPGLCGFVGELFVMLGAWNYHPALAIPAILTVVLTAAYLLWAWQRVFLGTNEQTAAYPDLSMREFLVLIPFVLLALVLGIIPQKILMNWMEPSLTGWVENLSRLKP